MPSIDKWISWRDYDYTQLETLPGVVWPQKRRPESCKGWEYKNIVCCLDIETSKVCYRVDQQTIAGKLEITPRYQAFMYVWMVAMDNTVLYGRTWDEFKEFVFHVKHAIHGNRIVMYVHNLSYEFQFLSGIFDIPSESVFAISARKVVKCTIEDCVELRCSYILSNATLARWCSDLRVEHQKMVGDLDYNVIRYPWTEITETERGYMINDVLGVVECVKTVMQRDGDTLCTIPMTSTGYVRRMCRDAMYSYNRQVVQRQMPDLELWRACREAFRGGDTHANRWYVDQILTDVKSCDRSSSYPDVICNERFPSSAFTRHTLTGDHKKDLWKLKTEIRGGHAVLARVRLCNVSLRDDLNGFPYLPYDKCRSVVHAVRDNGRILSADALEITITDIDLRIIAREYNCTIMVLDMWSARYGLLPWPLREVVRKLYHSKTTLKGVEGKELQYQDSKAKINACYGMAAQNPVKQSIVYCDGEWSETETPEGELLESYNNKAFLCYQWGVWVTAHARYQLRKMLWAAGHQALYCDTDSVKYIGEVDWSKYNEERMTKSINSDSYADDIKGIRHYMGVAEPDGHYKRFVTLGAKKYAYEDVDKTGKTHLHITIAGVSKKRGGEYLAGTGGLEALKVGYTFPGGWGGGTEALYNDYPEITEYTDPDTGRVMEITRNVVLLDHQYQVGRSDDYMYILQCCADEMRELDRRY